MKSAKKEAPIILALGLSPFVGALLLSAIFPFATISIANRNIAAGDGLSFPSFVLAAILAAIIIFSMRNFAQDPKNLKHGTWLTLICSLISIPVWSVGLLTSVNGLSLNEMNQTAMQVVRIETSRVSKSRNLHHWIVLQKMDGHSSLSNGRYFIGETTFNLFGKTQAEVAVIDHANGLLGAEVILGITPR